MYKIFLLTLTSLATYATVFGCDCNWDQTEEQQFCLFDFVLRATTVKKKVLGDPMNPEDAEYKYSLNVTKIFKGKKYFNPKKEVVVFSSILNYRCGLELADKVDYLLGGFYSERKASINQCDWARRWPKEVTANISKILAGNNTCS